MATLYILGNGFDKAHGFKCGYQDFKAFAKKQYPETFARLNDYYCESDLWSDLEHALGKPNDDEVAEASRLLGVDLDDPNIVGLLKLAFRDWVISMKTETPPRPKYGIPSKEDAFITFNYTTLLEDPHAYGIDEVNILHIHGYVPKAFWRLEDLIVGHNEPIKENESKLLASARKPIKQAIEKHGQKISRLCKNKDCVRVIGYSYSDIDFPYFAYISELAPNVTWELGYFSDSDRQNAELYSQKLNLINPIYFSTQGGFDAWKK